MATSDELVDQFWADLPRYRSDPVAFAREILRVETLTDELAEKQIEAMLAVATSPSVLVLSCNGFGKTWLAAVLVLWWLLTRPWSKVVTTATTWPQVRNVLWGAIRRLYSRVAPMMGFDCLDTRLEIAPEWLAVGLSVRDPNAMLGHHAQEVLVIGDEAQGIPRPTLDAMERLGMGPHCRILLLANPGASSGPCWELSQRPDVCRTIILTAWDHPNVKSGRELVPGAITRDWVERMARRHGTDSAFYRAAVLAEFTDMDDEAVVPMAVARAALDIQVGGEGYAGPDDQTIYLGFDVAGRGVDRNVGFLRRGFGVLRAWEWRGTDEMRTLGHIVAIIRQEKVDPRNVRIDASGLGSPMASRLHELGIKVVRVNFGGRPVGDYRDLVGRETPLGNRRAELYWCARRLLQEQWIGLPRATWADILIADLCAPRYYQDSAGRYMIEPKDEVKKRLGRSPDYGDAFVTCLVPPPRHPARHSLAVAVPPQAAGDASVPPKMEDGESSPWTRMASFDPTADTSDPVGRRLAGAVEEED